MNESSREAPGLLESLARYRWMVLVIALVFAALGAGSGWLLAQPTASARFGLTDTAGASLLAPEGTASSSALARYAAQRAQFVGSDQVLDAVAERLDDGRTAADLRDQVDASAVGDSDVVAVTATGMDPAAAAELADAVVAAYREQTQEQNETLAEQSQEAVAEARARLLERLGTQAPASPAGQAATATLSQLESKAANITVLAGQLDDSVQFVDSAETEGSARLFSAIRSGVAGLLVGLVLAAVIAYLRAERSGTVDDSELPAEILGAPLLGEVAELRSPEQRRALTSLRRMPREPFQFVAAGVRVVLPSGVLLVTSPDRGDGRTSVAASVAAAAARDGLRVALVDADARHRRLTLQESSGPLTPGLTDLATGTADLDAAQEVVAVSAARSLTFVSVGTRTDDLPGVFRSPGLAAALRQLRLTHDLVVLDTPAALVYPDALALAGLVDGVVVVVQPQTSQRRLRDLRRRLDLYPATVLGYAFNRSASAATDEPEVLPAVPLERAAGRAGRRAR